ncbi:DUF427 domain-containing protein [Methylobacterium sp. 37f]|uniref:DUF427 domain-containing protein n=1 Tax=Methylobacterium sp. 37f TaxID=2817058 RepID=UPI001FFD1FB0|nr:DUF427 domain-containing protein [Methylobacterium sp. 37f]MCK2053474.1 DUF427 domain-containing protein [Methylobacterium sp. 37f]
MRQPGADHPITILPHPGRIRIRLAGTLLAETDAALMLTEANYPPVVYVPRADARWAHFTPTARRTHCPYKGDASYFSLTTPDASRADAVWSYEAPYPAVAAIAGHLAFYTDKIDPIELA